MAWGLEEESNADEDHEVSVREGGACVDQTQSLVVFAGVICGSKILDFNCLRIWAPMVCECA